MRNTLMCDESMIASRVRKVDAAQFSWFGHAERISKLCRVEE